ncbi:MAG: hypothetical protein IPI55_02205 [Flavobacteriales bacterium]|nr:hypothetical protein [Flavobacteriales bacterium]
MSDEIQKVPGAGGTPLAPGAASRFGQKFQQAAQKVTSPMEIPRVFHQLVIFLLDGSGSMTADGRSGRTKGEELHDAMSKVLERLQVSRNKNCFDISCRVYSTEEKQIIAQQSVTQLALDAWSFDPGSHRSGRDLPHNQWKPHSRKREPICRIRRTSEQCAHHPVHGRRFP